MLGVLGSSGGARADRIARMAALSPRSALAELTGAVQAPYLFSVPATFESGSQEFADGSMDATILGADTWVTGVVFDIQVPSAFPGDVFQSLYEFLYNKTSGLAVEIKVTGSPRYDVVQNPAPLSNAADFIGGQHWPCGWLLLRSNGVQMRFTPLVPLPNTPLTVTATFRGWQYLCQDIDSMPIDEVFKRLAALGLDAENIKLARSMRDSY